MAVWVPGLQWRGAAVGAPRGDATSEARVGGGVHSGSRQGWGRGWRHVGDAQE